MGDVQFSAAELATREAVVRWRYPQSPRPRTGALAQLIESALALAALERLGSPLDPAALEAELARVETHTRDRAGLRRLQAICGDHYPRVGVLPELARRELEAAYARDTRTQRERLDQARSALNRLRAAGPQADLAAIARDDPTWRHGSSAFSPERGFFRPGQTSADEVLEAPPQVAQALRAPSPAWEEYERELFAPTPLGEVVPRVVSSPEGFVLLRCTGWLDAEAQVRRVERLVLPRRPLGEFLWEDVAPRVRVELRDPAWEEALEQLPWVDRLRRE